MMRSSRMGGGRMFRAANQVVSGKEAFSVGAGNATVTMRGGSGDLRAVSVPSPLPPAGATSPTYAGGAVLWNDWETVHTNEEMLPESWYLETAPRPEEVNAAILSLQQMPISSLFTEERGDTDDDDDDENSNSGSAEREIVSVPRTSVSTDAESDWIEPAIHASNELSAANNCQKALEAFHLLKSNPTIQRMVLSLSSDKAVWDAVMKNEAVQEIKKSLCEGIADAKAKINTGPVERMISALGTIFRNTKTTVMELIEKMTAFVDNLVHSSGKKGDEDPGFFSDAVKSSLMLSIFVFLIVIVGRLQK